jgi:hypothetical protein
MDNVHVVIIGDVCPASYKIGLHGDKLRDVFNLTLVTTDWVLCTVSNKTALFVDPVYAFGMQRYQDNFTKLGDGVYPTKLVA